MSYECRAKYFHPSFMKRLIESLVALILFGVVLPVFLIVCIGLVVNGVKPLFVIRRSAGSTNLEFNCPATGFGEFLRHFSAEKIPSLLWVVAGRTRLNDAIHRFTD